MKLPSPAPAPAEERTLYVLLGALAMELNMTHGLSLMVEWIGWFPHPTRPACGTLPPRPALAAHVGCCGWPCAADHLGEAFSVLPGGAGRALYVLHRDAPIVEAMWPQSDASYLPRGAYVVVFDDRAIADL